MINQLLAFCFTVRSLLNWFGYVFPLFIYQYLQYCWKSWQGLGLFILNKIGTMKEGLACLLLFNVEALKGNNWWLWTWTNWMLLSTFQVLPKVAQFKIATAAWFIPLAVTTGMQVFVLLWKKKWFQALVILHMNINGYVQIDWDT